MRRIDIVAMYVAMTLFIESMRYRKHADLIGMADTSIMHNQFMKNRLFSSGLITNASSSKSNALNYNELNMASRRIIISSEKCTCLKVKSENCTKSQSELIVMMKKTEVKHRCLGLNHTAFLNHPLLILHMRVYSG